MQGNSWVLLLVNDLEQREIVRRRLLELEVVPITVRADRATAAVERYRPIAALLDDAHAALAPEEFLESTCTHRVRLVTLPAHTLADPISDSVLRDVTSRRPVT